MNLKKIVILTVLFTVSSCHVRNISKYKITSYNLDYLLMGFTLEKTTISEIKNRYKFVEEKPGNFNNFRSLIIKPTLNRLLVSNEGILRAVRIDKDISEWETIAAALEANFTLIKPHRASLKTFVAPNGIVIELAKNVVFEFIVIEISSAKFRRERIEKYKIEARKGSEYYQRLLNGLEEPY